MDLPYCDLVYTRADGTKVYECEDSREKEFIASVPVLMVLAYVTLRVSVNMIKRAF